MRLAGLGEALSDHSDIETAYLFGSQARGDTHAESDYDVGIIFKTHAADRLAAQMRVDQIREELESQLHTELDVVDLEFAPIPLQFSIIKGNMLFTKNSTRCHRLENSVMSRMEIDYTL